MTIIFPPHYPEIQGPVVFLAGPIQGALDWQQEAIDELNIISPSLHIASPRKDYLDGTFVYSEQVDWETFFLQKANKTGVILFWLAKEAVHTCERAYGQTTRFELGEWKARHEYENTKIVVGIENGFTNARYIQRRLAQDCPAIPICFTLKEVCQKAVALIES